MKKPKLIIKGINYCHRMKRELWLKQLQRRNHNHDFSLITNDCVGGVICHDLGEQFRSPTVNLWIPNTQFLPFAQNLAYYLSCEMINTPDASKTYPVGTIVPKDDDHIPIQVYFEHYTSFEAAYAKWQKRSRRVNYDRLYFIWHFFDEENTVDLRAFDQWNVNKLIILHAPLDDIQHAAVTDCYNQNPRHGKLLNVIEQTGRRYLDEIDYLGFLNGKG